MEENERQGKCEKDDNVDASKKQAVVKFKQQSSLMFDGKGRNNPNVSEPIHSMCKIVITTEEGSKVTPEWKEVTREADESKLNSLTGNDVYMRHLKRPFVAL